MRANFLQLAVIKTPTIEIQEEDEFGEEILTYDAEEYKVQITMVSGTEEDTAERDNDVIRYTMMCGPEVRMTQLSIVEWTDHEDEERPVHVARVDGRPVMHKSSRGNHHQEAQLVEVVG